MTDNEPEGELAAESPAGPQVEPVYPHRRRRYIVQAVVALVIIAAIVITASILINNQKTSTKQLTTSRAEAPKNMASGGVLMQGSGGKIVTTRTPAERIEHTVATDVSKLSGTAHIVEYVDLQCPYCLEFEETNLNNVAGWVQSGQATLEIHPIAFLDDSSEGTRYSSRADNAVACVANYDPDRFLDALAELYAHQPAEGTTGLSNAKILSYLKTAGASSGVITSCVNGEQYKTWVTATTDEVEAGTFAGVANTPAAFQGTPTVFVNGKPYTGSLSDASTFTAFVNTQAAG